MTTPFTATPEQLALALANAKRRKLLLDVMKTSRNNTAGPARGFMNAMIQLLEEDLA